MGHREPSKSQLGISVTSDHPKIFDFINGKSVKETSGLSLLNSIFSKKTADTNKTVPISNPIREVNTSSVK